MDKLLIVDGSNLLFQMFFGMPARIVNEKGKAIQGTLGFVGALLKIIRMTKPTHVLAVFDGETANPRRELDEDYKSNRTDYNGWEEEDTPFSQLPDIYTALDELGICYRETEGCEADDWIAGYAKACGETMDVVIASQDSDFYQLITERVCILRYRGKSSQICDCAYIREKLGIAPQQYAAYKSLTGDASDNIRGVPKVGPKTAAELINSFGDLQNLLENAQNISKASIRESVTSNVGRIRKNYQLILLSGCAELPFELPELVWQDEGLTTTQVLQKCGIK
ncbi:MAG: flap endonuclease [Oscillospiraceae bacterium]|nr:flap endonuclease [Oscillospiraceae bacterium]